jgi:hypothetical protein
MDILTIVDGKITEVWATVDIMGLMHLIGAIPQCLANSSSNNDPASLRRSIEIKDMHQARSDAIKVHKFMICDHRLFALLHFSSKQRKKKYEAANDTHD